MPMIPFGEWMPDAARLGNPGALRVANCLPGLNSYKPVGSFRPVTNATTARPRGAISVIDKANNLHQYAGDATKLYRVSNNVWTDSSKGAGYASSSLERWGFARWGNRVLATNFSDHIQTIEMGGTIFADLTTAFKARHIAVIRDHVFAAYTNDADGVLPDRLRWSAFNSATDWTVSPVTGADVRDLNAGGAIQGIVGGEYGVMISESSTWRISFVGAPTWFQIDEVLPGVGAVASGSVAQLGDTVYFLSEQGFVAVQGATGVGYIGAGKVDNFIRQDLDETHLDRMSVTVDPRGGRIIWAYPGVGNVAGRPNRLAVYDKTFNKWSLIERDVELLWKSRTSGLTLDELDTISSSIDALPASLDSPRWQGGAAQFAAFDEAFRSGFFDGAPMVAEIDTKEIEIHPGYRAMLNAFRPVVDGGSVVARVAERSRQTNQVAWSGQLAQSNSGRFTHRSHARYHTFRLSISGDWIDAIGVDVDPREVRRGDGRG